MKQFFILGCIVVVSSAPALSAEYGWEAAQQQQRAYEAQRSMQSYTNNYINGIQNSNRNSSTSASNPGINYGETNQWRNYFATPVAPKRTLNDELLSAHAKKMADADADRGKPAPEEANRVALTDFYIKHGFDGYTASRLANADINKAEADKPRKSAAELEREKRNDPAQIARGAAAGEMWALMEKVFSTKGNDKERIVWVEKALESTETQEFHTDRRIMLLNIALDIRGPNGTVQDAEKYRRWQGIYGDARGRVNDDKVRSSTKPADFKPWPAVRLAAARKFAEAAKDPGKWNAAAYKEMEVLLSSVIYSYHDGTYLTFEQNAARFEQAFYQLNYEMSQPGDRLKIMGQAWANHKPAFITAAEAGDPRAKAWLSQGALDGYLTLVKGDTRSQANIDVAVQYAEAAKNAEDPLGLILWAAILYNRAERETDAAKKAELQHEAFLNAQRSAAKGNVDSLRYLANFYLRGIGVEKNRAEAIDCLEAAIDAGSIKASDALITVLMANPTPETNPRLYELVQEQVAAKGFKAYATLGMLHLRGLGTPQDTKQALEWCDKAAEQGDWDGIRTATKIRMEGAPGLPAQGDGALQALGVWVEASGFYLDERDRSYMVACFYAGEAGLSPWLPADNTKAQRWFQYAAERGHTEARQRYNDLVAKTRAAATP